MWIEASSGETATPITPSDSTPVALAANAAVKPTERGYAIKSSPASVTPSDDTRVHLTKDSIIKPTESGYAIKNYPMSVTPSDVNIVSATSGMYRFTDSGNIIKSFPDTVIPSNENPVALTAGKINKIAERDGYAIKDLPISVQPNNSTTPPVLEAGKIYKPSEGGYAIKNASIVTPAYPSAGGTYFSSGIINMGSSGYAYNKIPVIEFDSVTKDGTTASTSHVMAVFSNSRYVLLVYMNSGSSQLPYDRYDNAEIKPNNNSILSIYFMGNLTDTNAYVVGSFFSITTTSNTSSITITTTNNSRIALFRARLI